MLSINLRMMAHNVVENVVKQGYLKKGNSISTRLSGFFRRNDGHKWFVFTIRRGVPYLEYYDNDVDVFTQHPINSFNLSNCQNVKSLGNSNPTAFCIVCPDRIIELVASSRTQMVGWVNEMEASLVRLGVLKMDISDHVYTVCPAVVRKPRPSKEVLEEKDDEADSTNAEPDLPATSSASTTTATTIATTVSQDNTTRAAGLLSTTDSSQQSNPSPHVSPSSHQRAKTVRQSSVSRPIPLPPRSSVRQQSVPALRYGDSPPPLPSRPSPLACRPVPDSVNAFSENSVTGSSSDSDFVSAEVIAEILRLKRGLSEGSVSAQSEIGAGLLHETTKSSKTNSFSKTSHVVPQSNPHSHNQSVSVADDRPESPIFGSAVQFQNQCVSSINRNSHSDTFSSSSSTLSSDPDQPLGIMELPRISITTENDYSALPGMGNEEDNLPYQDTDQNQSAFTCVSKPMPLPRKTGSKKINVTVPETVESNVQTDWKHDNAVSSTQVNTLQLSENTLSKVLVENPDADINDGKHDSEKSDGGKDSNGTINTKESKDSNDTEKESQQTKDENENFYGLMYGKNSPPTTMAPPVPSAPPLPPRHDSLPHAKDSIKLDAGSSLTEFKHSASSSSSSTTSSATAITSQSEGQADSLPVTAAVPPLPRPRKKGPNSESHRKSLPLSAFSNNDTLDTPPMPPRHISPQHSFTEEDRPPALPVRNSHQSFFIKRPQLTGMAVSGMINGEMSTVTKEVQTNPAFGDQDVGAAGYQESGTRSSAPELSCKMRLDRAHSLHTVVSLKQTQAEILQHEIDMPSVSVQLTQKSGFGLALVEWNSFACVAGWNQKDFPSLHGKLHIGDMIFSVNNVKITSPEIAQKLLKQAPSSKIDITLHRMPHAKVFAIRRNADGQSLGIKREGGTGEIVYVDPNGLAAQHGLTQYASSAFGNTRCNWFLTEINNRPLNLFFKDSEIEHRLAAVGREISIVVQPSDFIYEIRRRFKKLRNYKSYITQ